MLAFNDDDDPLLDTREVTTATTGVRRSASRKYLRPRLDGNGIAVAAQEGQAVRRVGGDMKTVYEGEADRTNGNLRRLRIDTSTSAARGKFTYLRLIHVV